MSPTFLSTNFKKFVNTAVKTTIFFFDKVLYHKGYSRFTKTYNTFNKWIFSWIVDKDVISRFRKIIENIQ